MKKLLKSKKALAATALSLMMAVSGMSYAWWIDNGSPNPIDVSLGYLKMETEMDAINKDDKFEPGAKIEITGSVRNAGDIYMNVFARGANSTVKFRDLTGNGAPADEAIYSDPSAPIYFEFDTTKTEIGYDLTEGEEIFWLQSNANPDDYIIIIAPQISVPVGYTINVKKNLDMKYNGAKINFNNGWEATLSDDEATYEVFGANLNDYTLVDNELTDGGATPFGGSNYELAQAKLDEILGRE